MLRTWIIATVALCIMLMVACTAQDEEPSTTPTAEATATTPASESTATPEPTVTPTMSPTPSPDPTPSPTPEPVAQATPEATPTTIPDTEEGCAEIGGFWSYAGECHPRTPEEQCADADGLWHDGECDSRTGPERCADVGGTWGSAPETGAPQCDTVIPEEQAAQDQCQRDGGYWDYYVGRCKDEATEAEKARACENSGGGWEPYNGVCISAEAMARYHARTACTNTGGRWEEDESCTPVEVWCTSTDLNSLRLDPTRAEESGDCYMLTAKVTQYDDITGDLNFLAYVGGEHMEVARMGRDPTLNFTRNWPLIAFTVSHEQAQVIPRVNPATRDLKPWVWLYAKAAGTLTYLTARATNTIPLLEVVVVVGVPLSTR